jgi:hypothetical protein
MTNLRAGARTLAILSCALVGALLVMVVKGTGPLPQIHFGRDLIYLLDGAWKLKWSALPQTQYYSPVGSLAFLSLAAAMNLTGSIVKAPVMAICTFGILLLPMALYAAFRGLQLLIGWFAALVIMATAMAPHVAGFSGDAWSYAAFYDRWEQALFCTLILVVALVPRDKLPRSEMLDGAIAGIVITALIFLNIGLGVLALLIWIAFGITARRPLLHYIAAAVIGAVVGIVIVGLLRWNMPNLARALTLEIQAWHDGQTRKFLEWILKLAPELLLVALLTGLWCASGIITQKVRPLRRIAEAIVFLACLGIAALLAAMAGRPAGDLAESPVLCIGALILLSRIIVEVRREKDAPEHPTNQGRAVLIAAATILAVCLVIPQTTRNLYGITQAAIWKYQGRMLPARQVFQSGALQGLEIQFFGGNPPTPTSYVGTVIDGLALLARTNNANKTVTALDFSNPFNVARGIKPSDAVPIAGPSDCTYAETALPPAEAVFNGRDVVLVPKRTGAEDQKLRILWDHYRSYLTEHYRVAGESQQWQLLVPK